jgi:hypothetical protein
VTLPALDVTQATRAEAIVLQIDAVQSYESPNSLVRGSGEGATKAMGEYLGNPPSGDGGVLWLLTLPVALPISAVVGAGMSHSEEEVDAALAAYDRVRHDEAFQDSIGRQILGAMKDNTAGQWSCIELASDSEPRSCATYQSIAQMQLYSDFALKVVGEYDPDIHFFGTVVGHVSTDHVEKNAYVSAKWAYRDELGDFFALTANDAALLRSELKAILDRFVTGIVEDLFLEPHQETVVRKENFAGLATTEIPQAVVVRVGLADVLSECQKYDWLRRVTCI